jgi:hypothetical protein
VWNTPRPEGLSRHGDIRVERIPEFKSISPWETTDETHEGLGSDSLESGDW